MELKLQLLYSSFAIMNKKVIKCSNRRQEISPLKPHILNPMKKFMQLSLQTYASSNFST